MNVSKVAINTAHRKWCMDFMTEQRKTTRMVRNFVRQSSIYNPFGFSKEIDEILKRYEKNFW